MSQHHALAPDERPAAATRESRAGRDPAPAAILIGKELEAERMASAFAAAVLACDTLKDAIASGYALRANAAALVMHREARVAFGLAAGLHRDLSEHLRREPRVRR